MPYFLINYSSSVDSLSSVSVSVVSVFSLVLASIFIFLIASMNSICSLTAEAVKS